MSLVAKVVAPAVIGISSVLSVYQQRGLLSNSRKMAFVKGTCSLAACVALQLAVIHRSALGGRPSNVQGLLALLYPILLPVSMVLTFILYHELPLSVVLAFFGGTSRLGASGNNQPVYQYRLNDVIDRVREIVGDRINQSSDDFRER